jgi:alpha-glucosidase
MVRQQLQAASGSDVDNQWWTRAVIYENHLPSFRDGDGDGVGDLPGLTESLAYLDETLGVDTIWTGPFYKSPLLDHGFDVSDFYAVEPTFGTLADVETLLTEARRRSMRVIVDYIPNHSSDQHPWFTDSRSSRDSRRRDWYVWRDPAPDGGPPNNWTSEAGGSVWECDPATGQFYLHSHLVEQPDLNWRNPEVRTEMLNVLRYWLDKGADGVRIDVAHMLMKDPDFRDNPVDEDVSPNAYDIQHSDFASQRHIYDRRHPDTFDVLREIRAVVDEYPGRACLGEIEAMPWSEWARYFGTELDGLHMSFAFGLIETPWRARALARTVDDMLAAIPEGGWPLLALGNHDRPRLATRVGRPQARVAAVMLLTLRGTPTLFYGDELGLQDQVVPPGRGRDYFARLPGGASRDLVRTPMPWSAAPNGGFSDAPESSLWLPPSIEIGSIDVATQLGDPSSSLSLYRRLLALRRQSPALTTGAYRPLALGDPQDPYAADTWVYERTWGADRKVVALNTGPRAQRVYADVDGVVEVSTIPHREGAAVRGELALLPDEAVVIDASRT